MPITYEIRAPRYADLPGVVRKYEREERRQLEEEYLKKFTLTPRGARKLARQRQREMNELRQGFRPVERGETPRSLENPYGPSERKYMRKEMLRRFEGPGGGAEKLLNAQKRRKK